eukprot:gene16719-18413_t
MSRESVEPLFTKQTRPGPLMPTVMILPKIGKDQQLNCSSEQASFTVMKKPTMPPTPEPDYDDDIEIINDVAKIEETARNNDEINGNRDVIKRTDCVFKPDTATTTKSTASGDCAQLPPRNPVNNKKENKFSQERLKKDLSVTKKRLPNQCDIIDASKTFEDCSRRDLWHQSKSSLSLSSTLSSSAQPPLLRRCSVCSSCGGARSSSMLSTSSRRFSAVSIDVASEHAGMDERRRNDLLRRQVVSNSMSNKSTPRKISNKDFQRIETEKNLLYDLMSVLYKKNIPFLAGDHVGLKTPPQLGTENEELHKGRNTTIRSTCIRDDQAF